MDSFKTTICGVETVIVWRRFQNKQFLVITQYGKMGNVFVIRPEVDPCSQMGLITDTMDIQCHFGQDTDELQVAVRRILSQSGLIRKGPVVVSLALKEISKPVLDEIANTLRTQFTR